MALVYSNNSTAVGLFHKATGAARDKLVHSLLLQIGNISANDLPVEPKHDRGAAEHSYVLPPNVGVSFSHTAEQMLVAVALNGRVGVDQEKVDSINNWKEVAQTWYAPEEFRWLENLSPQNFEYEACRIWTRKEAVAKYLGQGVGWIEKRVSVLTSNIGPIQILDLNMPAGFAATLAIAQT